jgi:hypothetical protein
MIKMFAEGAVCRPRIFCDECGALIEHADDGRVLWLVDDERSTSGNAPSFVHIACVEAFDLDHQPRYAWLPLALFPVQLAANLRLRWGDKTVLELAKTWSSIG